MQRPVKITKSPVQTKNEQKRLITQNQSILKSNEQEVLKIIKDYLNYNECTEPMDAISFLHQEFLENHENITEFKPEYICSLNFQIQSLYLLLARLQVCSSNILNSTRMLDLLTANPA